MGATKASEDLRDHVALPAQRLSERETSAKEASTLFGRWKPAEEPSHRSHPGTRQPRAGEETWSSGPDRSRAPTTPGRFLHPGLSYFATGEAFHHHHHVIATHLCKIGGQTGAIAIDVGPRDWRPESDGRGPPAVSGGRCCLKGSLVREDGEMRREENLALWITLAAALAAAESPPDQCHSPKTVGPCRASFHRWWYNATSQSCQEFIFGGCKGNANNFLSEQECFQTCTRVATPRAGHHPEAYENKPGFREFCAAPQVVGPCRASFLRWYFDLESRTCKKFVYGGCRGNKNNYLQEEHCWSQCTADGEITKEPGDTDAHPRLPSEPFSFSTRAVILAVLLAILVTILLASMGVFFVKICRKNPELSVGTVWSTLDDKEYLMSNAYTL